MTRFGGTTPRELEVQTNDVVVLVSQTAASIPFAEGGLPGGEGGCGASFPIMRRRGKADKADRVVFRCGRKGPRLVVRLSLVLLRGSLLVVVLCTSGDGVPTLGIELLAVLAARCAALTRS